MTIASKLPDVGITIFTVMSKLAADHGAINLSQGFPDFDAPAELIERVGHHMRSGMNQYAPMQGVPALRQRIAEKIKALYDCDVDPDTWITITSGATEALFAAISAVVRPGDEVIVVEPAYDAYVPVIQLNGGVPVFIPLSFPDYTVDWDRLRDALTARTRLIILNSPHNPTGTVLDTEDMAALKAIAADRDLFILGDEVYEHIVFDGRVHQSLLRHPELARKSFVVSSFGKTYHTTGWKIGYCVAPPEMTVEFQKIHQFLTFTSNTPIQLAYADYMQHTEHYLQLAGFYQRKRDLFLDCMRTSRFKPLPCAGTYFQMMDYSAITDAPDIEFARRLTTEFGVAAIPPSVFYHDRRDHQVLRFCFAKQDQTLIQAAELLCRI
ncbi:pyridoxal phosphate-dependent aminotransferase [Desulfatitalea tepidiphila]|uniref:pyridoxal phosphate-dependent aminotransferase n=1 Tax=Desulfatitalea tepidiphila TaxID=1185843 RepID=UPI0006B49158|nr:pyridoxal phosphate-dependent aminotransferase [Desulfatitalea tepidiphila]